MISDDFGLQILRALATADRFGWSLHDLACAVWPQKDRDPRQHSVLGAACSELLEQELVISSGGRKARWALSPKGERHLANYRLSPAAPEAQTANPPFSYQPQPLPAHVTLIIDWAMRPLPECAGMRDAQRDARYRQMYDSTVAALHQACAGDHTLFTAAGEEWGRRVRADIARIRTSLYGSPTAGPPPGAPVWS